MTTWTSPETEEQKRYYSKRKGKLQAYGIAALFIQLLWAYFDFPAYTYVLDGAFKSMPSLLWTTPFAAGGLLIIMHYILRETYTTYWFDRLDDKEETDSSIAIPIVLILVLFAAGRYGVKMSIESKLPEPEKRETNEAKQMLQADTDRLRQNCVEDTTNTNHSFGARISAATLSIDTRLNALKKRRPADLHEQQVVRGEIRQLQQKRADIVAPLAQAQADSISSIVNRFNAAKAHSEASYNVAVVSVDNHNNKVSTEHEATLSNISFGSWLLSGFFVFIYCALGYAIVTIKVKAGILPIRDHTVLDQYGGPIGRLLYVFQDAFNRQVYRFSIAIHEIATRGTSVLHEMDATYLDGQADYHLRNALTPTLSTGHDVSDDDARSKVIAKAVQLITQNPNFVPTESDLKKEFVLAKQMNGTYMAAPWGGNSTPSASATALNNTTVPQTATTVAQQKQVIHASSPDDVVKFYHMKLQKEPSNFRNPQALRTSVMDRVVKDMVKATQAIQPMKYGDVSEDVCIRFRSFLYRQLLQHLDEQYAKDAFTQLDNALIVLYDAKEGEGA